MQGKQRPRVTQPENIVHAVISSVAHRRDSSTYVLLILICENRSPDKLKEKRVQCREMPPCTLLPQQSTLLQNTVTLRSITKETSS